MQEIWKQIKGFEGIYEISNFGRCKSKKRPKSINSTFKERILKPVIQANGYVVYNIHLNGKGKITRAHKLVAMAFIPNPENKPCINHKNGIKTDNRIENLEWCTSSENRIHAINVLKIVSGNKGKIGALCKSSIPVRQYTKSGEFIFEFACAKEAERLTKIRQTSICWCCKGKLKSAGGFLWKYSNKT